MSTFWVSRIAAILLFAAAVPGCISNRHIAKSPKRPVKVLDFSESQVANKTQEEPASDATSPAKDRVGLISYQVSAPDATDLSPDLVEELPPSPEANSVASPIGVVPDMEQESASPLSGTLTLEQVLESVTTCYPEIEIAIGELESAKGKVLASWGEFDSVISGHSISQPLGFYQTYRNGFGISQPVFTGGEVYGTYRIGDGNFEPWYGERETNEGGELKAGFSIPLLKDRAIDKRRTALRKAELQNQQLQSNVESRLLQFERFATQAYWDWVASGQAVKIQRQLIELANTRIKQIDIRIEKGDLALISKNDNDRFIAKRKNGLIKAEADERFAAIKLSIFLRDANCVPIVAGIDMLPTNFPLGQLISEGQLDSDILNVLATRPELIELRAMREEACVSLRYANNLLLPKLDIKGFAGQDLGGATSSKGDKTPFELQLGVFAGVPIQRREGAGKIQVAQGKIAQIDAKYQFVSDKLKAEIQYAATAVNAAVNQIEQSQETVRTNVLALQLAKRRFDEGDLDLLALNIYETDVANARLELLEAQYKYVSSLAIYRTIARSRAFEPDNN